MARIVLVADDSPTIQKRAMGILKGDGFEVETVSNGVAAIKRLAVLRPVVVLADVSMPGRDGYEVCDFVKKSPDLAQVPVILVASDMEPYDSAKGAHVKADGIIKKPFEARELIAIVVKFAEQFEAATISIADVPIAPPPRTEPEREFSLGGEQQESVPTVVQQVDPGFSQMAEGVAFAAPSSEDSQPFSLDSPGDEPESTLHIHSSPLDEYPLVAHAPVEPVQFAAPAHNEHEEIPSFMEHLTGAPVAPHFIDEHAGHAEDPAVLQPAILHAPMASGDESAHDDTVAAIADSDFADAAHPEPQFITEEPEFHTSHEHPHSHEHSHAHPHEHPHNHNAFGATSLDSFSLDDAAAGQVHFASAIPEVVYAAPAEEAAALEAVAPESTFEVAAAVSADGEALPEVVYAEPVPIEPAPEVGYTPPAAAETESVVAVTNDAPTEAREVEPIAVAAEHSIAGEPEREEALASEPALEATPSEQLITEAAPELSPADPGHSEFHLPMAATAGEVAASVGTAVEAIDAGIAHHDSVDDSATSPSTVIKSAPPATLAEEAAPEPLPAETVEPVANAATPRPAIDRETLYSIVVKVVMKMAPPMLTAEAVEQIAKHLTEEIATEISLEVPPSQH